MKTTIPLSLSLAVILAAGCSTPPTSQITPVPQEPAAAPKANPTAIEGTWKGREVTTDHEGTASLTFSGQTVTFHGADPSDWVKGTFTLREETKPKQLIGIVTESDSSDIIGKKVCAIYKIEDGTLTITGNGPDDPSFPAAFDASGARKFVLKLAE